jgi:hypothetical protein
MTRVTVSAIMLLFEVRGVPCGSQLDLRGSELGLKGA